jgi:hypothetical protein
MLSGEKPTAAALENAREMVGNWGDLGIWEFGDVEMEEKSGSPEDRKKIGKQRSRVVG